MPNRIIKESINESQDLGEVSPFAQDLFKRLITYADDYGRFNSDLEIMRARLYPRELESIAVDDLADGLIELCGVGKLGFYRAKHDMGENRKIFGQFPNWSAHQRVRNSRKKCPEPDEPINDWALQRFVPMLMKIEIFERDKFACRQCKHSFKLPGLSTKEAIRCLSSVLHVDHVVPVVQGGRATIENLRLLCASCHRARAKKISIQELTRTAYKQRYLPPPAASCGELRRAAASCGELRPESESESESYKSTPAAPSKIKNLHPQTEYDDLVHLAAEVGRLDKVETRQLTTHKLCQWTISMVRKLNKDPPERVQAVVRASLENVRRKINDGYEIKSLWGLLETIFNAERTKYIQGPEHEANKRAPIPPAFSELINGLAKTKAVK